MAYYIIGQYYVIGFYFFKIVNIKNGIFYVLLLQKRKVPESQRFVLTTPMTDFD